MLKIVLPIFMVILVGYAFGRLRKVPEGSDKLINDYVLYISLPALLFISIANANPSELLQWSFVLATLAGIVVAYILGLIIAYYKGLDSSKSSIIGMAACYGTTGYMGVPIAIAAFGNQAAVPAAIATILHNIPAIMAVILTHDIARSRSSGDGGLSVSLINALKTTILNPLTLAVILGGLISLLQLKLPELVNSFATFLGAAAGPTALFALGLGLANLDRKSGLSLGNVSNLSPIVFIKIIIQPLVVFLVGYYALGMRLDNIWFTVAILMSAQPIGAGVYVFASKYNFFKNESALSITVSLVATIMSLSFLLDFTKNFY